MAFFEHDSWQSVEILERCCGFWLNQNWFKKYIIRFISVLYMTTIAIPMALRLEKDWGVNFAIATENVLGMLMFMGYLTKFIMPCIYNKNRHELYEIVNGHYKTITEENEISVLSQVTEQAGKFCINYISLYIVTLVIFEILPIAKMFFDFLVNDRELEKLLPYHTDYGGFIDEDKHYLLVILHIIFGSMLYIIAICAYDFAFIMIVRHVYALFEIIKLRLQRASGFLDEFDWDMLDFKTADDKAYEVIKKAIDLHNDALKMVLSIEETYNICWFIVLIANLFIFSGGVYLVLLSLHEPVKLLRFFAFFISLFVHFIVQFLHGQLIIDSSSSVLDACYSIRWYVASTRTRRLLSIIMLRSSRPCIITGGRFFALSLESFCKMIKCGFSYYSVFRR